MQIHWHEGLFLLPHHLQRFQRNVHDQFIAERKLAWAYPYGTIDCHLSRDALEDMRLQFDRLRAIMPSGTVVDYPEGADLPTVEIKDALDKGGDFTVYLATPLWFPARSNCLTDEEAGDTRAKIIYRVTEQDWADENTGGNAKPILHRRVNARILLGEQDSSDLEAIPLLRVTRGTAEEVGLPRQDTEFVGPCLVLRGSSILFELVRDLNGQIQASRKELTIQVTRGGFSLEMLRGIQYEQLVRLKALNRASAQLETLIPVTGITPFDIYQVLRELLAELSALYPERDLYDCLPYNHDAPYPCFKEVAQKIRLLLQGNVTPNFIKVPFVDIEGNLTAALEEKHFTDPIDYYLGLSTKEDPLSLARFVENEDQFKLMPKSMANRAVRGILLKEERFPPLELPAQAGLYYFRLQRAECTEMWKRIQEEKSAVVRWSGNDNADYKVTLFMTLRANQ